MFSNWEQPINPRITKLSVDMENGKRWEYTRKDCIKGGGCCPRGCGCCEKARQINLNTTPGIRADTAISHCTIACGCYMMLYTGMRILFFFKGMQRWLSLAGLVYGNLNG